MSTRATTAPAPKAAPKEPATIDPRDQQLTNFQSFEIRDQKEVGTQHDAHLRVGNLPADRVTTWATDPRIDNGRCVSLFQQLGYRVVEIDEVTSNQAVESKIHVPYFEEGPNRAVAMGGGILMIGYRQYRDERKAWEETQALQQVAEREAGLDNLGIKHGGQSTRGGLKEV